MKRPQQFLVAIVAAALLAACSSAGAPGSSDSPGDPGSPASDLDGHAYLSISLDSPNPLLDVVPLVPGTRIRLAFADGAININGGCNTMGGAYRIDGDRIVTDQMSMTEMACDPPRMQQDDWLATYVSGSTFTLDGDTLILLNNDVRLTLLDEEVATPDLPLEGTTWVLDGIIAGDVVSSVPVGVNAAIRFGGGSVEVESGCNTGGGTVEVTADTLTFGAIGLTKMACGPDAMAVENAVIAALSGTTTYTIDAGVLTLNTGAAGLFFRAAP